MLRALMVAAAVLCATSIVAAAEPPHDGDHAAFAARRTAEGRALFEAGRLAEAHAALQQAFEAEGTPQQAANLGTVELLLERYRDAAEHLQRALTSLERAPREDAAPSALDEVRRSLDQAAREVGALDLRVSPEHAKVKLDGSELDLSASSLVFVEPGPHVLSASAEAHAHARVELTIDRGERRSVELVLAELPAAPPAPPVSTRAAPAARREPDGRPLGMVFATGAVALVGLSGGAVLLGVAKNRGAIAQRGAAELRARGALCQPMTAGVAAACQRVEEAADAHNALEAASVGAFVVGGAALLVGATYLLWRSPPPTNARIQASPLMTATTQGAALRGTF